MLVKHKHLMIDVFWRGVISIVLTYFFVKYFSIYGGVVGYNFYYVIITILFIIFLKEKTFHIDLKIIKEVFKYSIKGNSIFNRVKYRLFVKPTYFNEIVKGNPRIISGKYKNYEIRKRKLFFRNYFKYGYEYVENKFLKIKKSAYLLNKLKKMLKRMLK
ncbi:MAG: hypothetical protein BWX91_00023 [Spirochaetes bacterium ADurb.Bin133]|nr:MAG: hypothetical protein BWX91_00023 [Spirochaetes bacterium ADurb.Bin133]